MADQDQERWKKLVADFEASDLTPVEFANQVRTETRTVGEVS